MLFTYMTKDVPQEFQDFLNNISHSLKQKVSVYVMSRVLKTNPVILAISKNNDTQPVLNFIVSKMTITLTSPEEILITEGDSLESNKCLFMINRERLNVLYCIRSLHSVAKE